MAPAHRTNTGADPAYVISNADPSVQLCYPRPLEVAGLAANLVE